MTTEIRMKGKTVATGGNVLPYLRRQLKVQQILELAANTSTKKAEAQRRAAALRRMIARLDKTGNQNDFSGAENIETPEV